MFNWLRNWAINRHRMIFRYWDGKKWLRADPIVLFRGLRMHKVFNLDSDLEEWDREDPFSVKYDDEARQRCVSAVCDVFGVQILSQNRGLTENECGALLKTFVQYVIELKKSFSLLQTSAESTPASSFSSLSSASGPPPDLVMKPTVEDTSTSEGPNLDSPAILETEPKPSSDLINSSS